MLKKKTGNKKEVPNTPLGILYIKDRIGLLEQNWKDKEKFTFSWSDDGMVFATDKKEIVFLDGFKKHKPEQCSKFRFSSIGKKSYVTYIRTVKSENYRVIAEAKNIHEWEVLSENNIANIAESVIVSYPEVVKNHIIYEGGIFVKCLTGKDWEKLDDNNSLLFTTRHDRFDKDSIKLIGSFLSDHGITLFYESLEQNSDDTYNVCIGVVIFDKDDPRKIVYRSIDPIWKSDVAFSKKNICTSLGMIVKDANIYFFFSIDEIIITISISENDLSLHIPKVKAPTLIKHKQNPIIAPHSHNAWENEAVFNPAILRDDHGHIHLIYRAVGSDGISRLGYGYSKDGVRFNGRLPMPIFAMSNPRDGKKIIKVYDPKMYPSGGSWGGCEDPRAVKINGKIYITFNAFDGWDFIRIALVSIKEEDFLEQNWKWSKPMLISPPNQINKNWVLFPEKISGKFAILHSISPKVQIDYVKNLKDLENGDHIIKSTFKQDPSKKGWDSWVRGVGPPPLKTDKGWLVLYHAMDKRDPDKYKLGALLLDIKDPQKVLSRSHEPILEPEAWYENDGKPGVVYSCGAIIKDDILFVYYGGGDKHVCVATAPLKKVFSKLK